MMTQSQMHMVHKISMKNMLQKENRQEIKKQIKIFKAKARNEKGRSCLL